MSRPRSRRSVLRATAATGLSLAVAGCSALPRRTRGLRLGDVVVHNWHAEPHEVRLELERDGELVAETTLDVPGESLARMEATWPGDPAVYRLSFVVVGPAVETDVRVTELTGEDSQSDEDDCTIATLDFGMDTGGPVGVNLGPSEFSSGDCAG